MIKASVKFVRAYERSAKHRKKEIFNDGMREGLSVVQRGLVRFSTING